MCIKIIGESEFNQVVFLSVDTNASWKSLDINKEDIEKTVKQLIDVAYGLLEISDSDRDDDKKHEKTMNLWRIKNLTTEVKRYYPQDFKH